jgi:hypothetical protein
MVFKFKKVAFLEAAGTATHSQGDMVRWCNSIDLNGAERQSKTTFFQHQESTSYKKLACLKSKWKSYLTILYSYFCIYIYIKIPK